MTENELETHRVTYTTLNRGTLIRKTSYLVHSLSWLIVPGKTRAGAFKKYIHCLSN